MYAHIFKASTKGKWELITSRTPDLRTFYASTVYATKPEAKAAAKLAGAKAWNY
jgi:hypothetical protein